MKVIISEAAQISFPDGENPKRPPRDELLGEDGVSSFQTLPLGVKCCQDSASLQPLSELGSVLHTAGVLGVDMESHPSVKWHCSPFCAHVSFTQPFTLFPPLLTSSSS